MTRRAPALAVLACLLALALAPAAGAQETTWVRKDVKDLTAQEKKDFVDAILEMKRTTNRFGRRRISVYDFLVYYHRRASKGRVNGAHEGPAFLPWHRELLNAFEGALSNVAGKPIAVPYWDWTNPASTRALLEPDFMGGNGDRRANYAVRTGPFRKGRWKIKVKDNDKRKHPLAPSVDDNVNIPYIQRAFGTSPVARTLPTVAATERILAVERYDARPWDINAKLENSFRCAIEGWGSFVKGEEISGHNQVHMWVGGNVRIGTKNEQLGTITDATSPNDPIFWLLHANADRLWTKWQQENGRRNYLPKKGALLGHNLRDPLSQFSELGFGVSEDDWQDSKALRPIDLLDNRKLFVKYQEPLVADEEPLLID